MKATELQAWSGLQGLEHGLFGQVGLIWSLAPCGPIMAQNLRKNLNPQSSLKLLGIIKNPYLCMLQMLLPPDDLIFKVTVVWFCYCLILHSSKGVWVCSSVLLSVLPSVRHPLVPSFPPSPHSISEWKLLVSCSRTSRESYYKLENYCCWDLQNVSVNL